MEQKAKQHLVSPFLRGTEGGSQGKRGISREEGDLKGRGGSQGKRGISREEGDLKGRGGSQGK
ncbi:MAG: hypothetical protein RIG63_17005, partial [Coleofasciculus chthonoplastes F3-SA18-01]